MSATGDPFLPFERWLAEIARRHPDKDDGWGLDTLDVDAPAVADLRALVEAGRRHAALVAACEAALPRFIELRRYRAEREGEGTFEADFAEAEASLRAALGRP
jgi:hypothetical protein